MNFYKHWIGDYARDTGDLTLLEHGAFRLLLDAYYAADGALPADYDRLYRIARAYGPDEQLAVRTVADRFFPVEAGSDAGAYAGAMRRNKRADREIAEARKFTSAQSKRAKTRWRQNDTETDAGAYARASEDAGAMPGQMPGQYPEDASHSHSHSHSTYYDNNGSSSAGALRFENADQQAAYLGMRRASRNPAAFDATLRAILTGQTTGKPVDEAALGMALLELTANGEGFNASRVRGYLRKHEAAQQMPAPVRKPDIDAYGFSTKRLTPWTLSDSERAAIARESAAAAAVGGAA